MSEEEKTTQQIEEVKDNTAPTDSKKRKAEDISTGEKNNKETEETRVVKSSKKYEDSDFDLKKYEDSDFDLKVRNLLEKVILREKYDEIIEKRERTIEEGRQKEANAIILEGIQDISSAIAKGESIVHFDSQVVNSRLNDHLVGVKYHTTEEDWDPILWPLEYYFQSIGYKIVFSYWRKTKGHTRVCGMTVEIK